MANEKPQSYANHARFVLGFHGIMFGTLVLTLVGSVNNLTRSFNDHSRLYNAALIVALVAATLMLSWYTRIFSLKAQDRAIRAEENLRHYVLTGKLLDARLTVLQVVALRFASDAEFPALAAKAAETSMKPDDIKRAIQSWRADTYRV